MGEVQSAVAKVVMTGILEKEIDAKCELVVWNKLAFWANCFGQLPMQLTLCGNDSLVV